MSPRKFYLVCVFFICAVFSNAASISLYPEISLLGFNTSPSNTESKNYGQTQLSLPLDIFLNEIFSLQAEYFFAYDYFNKETDFYDKLNRTTLNFRTENLELKIGRDFLDIGLNSVIYFGYYPEDDLKKPTYFDGAFINYDFAQYFNITAFGGTFDKKDFYGATLGTTFIKGFYLLSKEQDLDLSTFGAALNIERETFTLDFTAAFNRGTEKKNILGLIFEEKYKGKMFDGNIKFKKQREDFNSEFSIGAQYLSPMKENTFGFRAINANLERGFIFGNLTEELETLTYKLGFKISPKILKDFTAEATIYNFTSTDKRKDNREIASEFDFSLIYQMEHLSVKFIYGYLQAQDGFNTYATGFEDKAKINKLGFILSYQF